MTLDFDRTVTAWIWEKKILLSHVFINCNIYCMSLLTILTGVRLCASFIVHLLQYPVLTVGTLTVGEDGQTGSHVFIIQRSLLLLWTAVKKEDLYS